MAILDILETAEGGRFFTNAAAACGLDEASARSISAKLATAIAHRIKDKAAEDPDAFASLLDLLEDGSDVDLQVEGSLTDHDAQTDGAEILNDLYGSAAGTNAVFKGLGGGIDKAALSTLTAINATAVLAALAASNAQTLGGGPTQVADAGGGSFFSVLIAALIKGFLQSAQRQLAPKRRRRRYTNTFGRRTSTRRRKQSVGLDDIFKEILGGRR
jgi:HPt (histidine-containing phosphotransfer) domain-containing protein